MRRYGLPLAGVLLALGWGAAPAWGASQARLTLEQVLGQTPGSLVISFGAIDAMCLAPPATGVTCVPNVPANGATWYATIRFRVRLTGAGGSSVRLTGVRMAGGSAPAGSLVDGPSGLPATPYPTAPAGALILATSLSGGNAVVQRSVGFRVAPGDPSGNWATSIVYSLIVE